jgi:hypothetical protein
MLEEEDLRVILEGYIPVRMNEAMERTHKHDDHLANVPHYTWSVGKSQSIPCSKNDQKQAHARIKFIDFSQLQKQRRKNRNPNQMQTSIAMNNSAAICHFLRSVLKVGPGGEESSFHSASPWRNVCVPDDAQNTTSSRSCPESDRTDQVIAILLRGNFSELDGQIGTDVIGEGGSIDWDKLEESEMREFENFRTGDACPNFYLYSTSVLKKNFRLEDLFKEIGCFSNPINHSQEDEDDDDDANHTLFLYRHLPPRPQFKSQLENGVPLLDGCLWQKFRSIEPDDPSKYKMVTPPYQDIHDVCGDLLDTFTNDENIKIMVEEAKKIPQWTPWPEKNHYQSEDDEDAGIDDSAYPASWTVFPLCHTFPAEDVSKRQFIPITCSYVPQTAKLLKSLGPALRTALFTRLEPRTTINAHQGWADLANHILRVHIPLYVPTGNDNAGLCGTWVDGCVQTHQNGRLTSFDDSKTHRAFNYTDEERVVLIVDLVRPLDKFPVGTSNGAHTDELEGFIKQFT